MELLTWEDLKGDRNFHKSRRQSRWKLRTQETTLPPLVGDSDQVGFQLWNSSRNRLPPLGSASSHVLAWLGFRLSLQEQLFLLVLSPFPGCSSRAAPSAQLAEEYLFLGVKICSCGANPNQSFNESIRAGESIVVSDAYFKACYENLTTLLQVETLQGLGILPAPCPAFGTIEQRKDNHSLSYIGHTTKSEFPVANKPKPQRIESGKKVSPQQMTSANRKELVALSGHI